MTKQDARREIELRIERETRYVLAMSGLRSNTDGFDILVRAIADNNKTLKLLGRYLEDQYGDSWEKFYRENFLEKT